MILSDDLAAHLGDGLWQRPDSPRRVIANAVIDFLTQPAQFQALSEIAAKKNGWADPFYSIRLTNGELVWDEYGWMACDGPEDFMVADESDSCENVEWETVLMVPIPQVRRTYPLLVWHEACDGDGCDDCDDGQVERESVK